MNKTQNYQLNQWEASDKVQRIDFNADNAKIDAAIAAVEAKADGKAEASALSALSQAVAAHTAALSKKGNCRVELLTYTGSGQYGADHPTVYRFSAQPLLFIAMGYGAILTGRGGAAATTGFSYSDLSHSTFPAQLDISWSGSRASFYSSTASDQLNKANTAYWVLAFYAMD